MTSLISGFIGVWLHPWSTMEDVKSQGENASIKSAMFFIIMMGLVSGVLSSIWGFITPPQPVLLGQVSRWSVLMAIGLVPAISFALSFVGTFVLWALIHGLLKGSLADYKTLYRLFAVLAAFSPVNSILAPIPKIGLYLGILINIWGLILLIQGVIIILNTPALRTWLSLGLIFIFLLLLGLVFRREVERQAAFGGAGMAEMGAANPGDLGTEDALNKELQDLAQKAKAESNTGTNPTNPAPNK